MHDAGDETAARPRRETVDGTLTGAGERHRRREQSLAAAHRRRRIRRYRSLVMHWAAGWLHRQRSAADVALPEVVPGQVCISFGGHATALVRYAGLTIACDPMLGHWVKGIKRAAPPGLTAQSMREVDLILISHVHADHLHRETLARLPRSATIVVPPGGAARVSGLGFARVVEIEVGQSIQDRGVDIATAPVRHGDGESVRALSYVIRGDGPSVYFCGDSGYFSGFAEIGARLQPDIALLPIGGYYPLSFRGQHMSPLDALYALEDLRARIMIPIHHGAFALSYERLDEPARWLAELVEERRLGDFVITLAPGESRLFVPPRRQRRDTQTDASGDVPGLRGPDTPDTPRSAAPGPEAALAAMPAGASPAWALPALRAETCIRESALHAERAAAGAARPAAGAARPAAGVASPAALPCELPTDGVPEVIVDMGDVLIDVFGDVLGDEALAAV
jgi:L-ascorbate metabolism protein UlaG (beta-lactamase superfamily)